MAVGNITSANSVYMLGVLILFPTAQKLENFGTDSAFDTEAVEMAIAEKGVDGKMVAGFVPFMNTQTITLSAASPSRALFDQVIAAQKTALQTYEFFGIIDMPSVGVSYVLSGGILTRGPLMPNAQRTLRPTQYTLMWDDITAGPLT
jgi:hypothetical protein